MDDLLPLLAARLHDLGSIVAVMEAALEDGLTFLPLTEAPAAEGLHVLEIYPPEGGEPALLLCEPAGEPSDGLYPVVVHAFGDDGREMITSWLAENREPGGPSLEAPSLEISSSVLPSLPPEDDRISIELRGSLLPSIPPADVAGRTLGGKYHVEALLGRGGMGNVYRVRHLGLDKPMALKILHSGFQHDAAFVASFQREALAASRLDHPNVVRVIDFGQEPDGLLYIVMELLTGSDLRAVLSHEQRLPLARIVDVMSQVCAALSASHEQGLVHRDVKPDNILLVPGRDDEGRPIEQVKVCDFGIAEREGAREEAGVERTASGTPDYMSPEQARAERPDVRSDLYSCGVILYEMATGRVPFASAETGPEILRAHVHEEPAPVSQWNPAVDRRLEAVIRKAMSKDPARRQQSARELRAELRALLAREEPRPAKPKLIAISEGLNAVPQTAQFRRSDAIDIDDLLGSADPWESDSEAGQAPEQMWILGEQQATALVKDPEAVLAPLDAITDAARYAKEMPAIERAMSALAHRGEAAALWAAVARLSGHARGAAPGDRTREGLAAQVLATVFARPEMLTPIAEAILTGPPAAREAGRRVMVAAGAAGAFALCAAREQPSSGAAPAKGEATQATRPRFVAALREVGPVGLGAITATLRQASARDDALAEDLLRAIGDGAAPASSGPAPSSAPLARSEAGAAAGEVVSSLLRHSAPAVRRAAVGALSSLWGARANAWLGPLLIEDADDGARLAAVGAIRRTGGIDREVVRRIEQILTGAVPAGDELRAASAAALADTTGPARAQAEAVLLQCLKPASSGFLSKLVTVETPESSLFVLTMARVLLALGSPEAAKTIEARAARSGAELKRELLELLR